MKKVVLLSVLVLVLCISLTAQNSYVGPEKCLQCHSGAFVGDFSGWRSSMHANGYSAVLDDTYSMVDKKGVVCDYDQNGVDDFKDGLDFNSISSVFDPYKPNAPILGYSAQTGYTITIGNATHRVYLTYGGSGLYKQRYGVRINTSEGESKDIYISPIQYNEKTHEYVLYHPDAWYDASNQPIYSTSSTLADAAGNSRSLAKGCAGCHVTGLTLDQTTNGEWVAHGAAIDPGTLGSYNDPNIFDLDGDGNMEQINTGCETCHGPGGNHVASLNPADIINPKTDLTPDQANNICGMCHSRGKSLPNNTFSFPYHDDTMTGWAPGDMVANIYTDGGGYWGDGINSKKHHQQFYDFYKSTKPTFQFHQVACYECHDVHNTVKHHIRETITEEDANQNPIDIAVDNDNNTLCLACHATHGYFADITKEMVADYANNEAAISQIVMKHTNHSWDPTNANATGGASRCSKCHMPKMAKSAVAYDIHSHTFEPVSPAKTLQYDMPNACAVSCHNKNAYTFGVDMSTDDFTNWGEQTDKDLANNLLFWYENMFFGEQNADGNMVNAQHITTSLTLDGVTDESEWSMVTPATIPLANEKSVDVMALYNDTDLYLSFKWADPTASFTRSAWTFDGSAWTTVAGQSEDRLALLWNMSIPAQDWAERGCMNKCHRNVDNTDPENAPGSEDDVYLPTGQKADMWHMKAARSLPVTSASGAGLTVDPATHEVTAGTVSMLGYIDDKYVGEFGGNANAPDGGRYGDAGSSTYSRNRNAAHDAPLYIETAPTDFMDAMVLTQSEIDNSEAVLVADQTSTDLQNYWNNYATLNAAVPERILDMPSGSRGDVMEAATWADGFWTVEIKRALNTGNVDDDATFAANNSYMFGIALMDNAGGDGHWSSGHALATLNLNDPTGISNNTVAVKQFSLKQNYPNPFNPTTTIGYDIAKTTRVNLSIFNLMGQKVATLVDDIQNQGTYNVPFNAENLPSGVYIYRLKTDHKVFSRKMVLMK